MKLRRALQALLTPALIVLGAMLTAALGARAQSVSVSDESVEIFDTDGDSAVLIDNGADYTAGGNGRTANLELRDLNGPATLFFNAFQAQLVLGGGDHEGIISIRDDDGVTTTIDLDGRIGRLLLGALGEDGDLIVNDGTATETIRMNGANGNVTNSEDGNGLVKAWARINADGSIASCWRCIGALGVGGGVYNVNFDIDVDDRPKTVTIDGHSSVVPNPGVARLGSPDADSVSVNISDLAGVGADRPFTLVVY